MVIAPARIAGRLDTPGKLVNQPRIMAVANNDPAPAGPPRQDCSAHVIGDNGSNASGRGFCKPLSPAPIDVLSPPASDHQQPD
jgi:hypothetical protein